MKIKDILEKLQKLDPETEFNSENLNEITSIAKSHIKKLAKENIERKKNLVQDINLKIEQLIKEREDIQALVDKKQEEIYNVRLEKAKIAFHFDEIMAFGEEIFKEKDFKYASAGHFNENGDLVREDQFGNWEFSDNGKTIGTTKISDIGGGVEWGAWFPVSKNAYFFPYGIDMNIKEEDLII